VQRSQSGLSTDLSTTWSAPTRSETKASLKTEEFDILVIGGGATGTGVAMDGAMRGL
jgi:glycerol-3-phosphate dehydrogenase